MNLDELYTRHIRPLPPADRLQLLAMMARDLTLDEQVGAVGERSLLELEGLGADLWNKVDPQAYVDSLREEWNHRT